jgi:hypothetical protein
MPALTHRRSTDAREECWHIYYGDIQAGTIASEAATPMMRTHGDGTAAFIRDLLGQ